MKTMKDTSIILTDNQQQEIDKVLKNIEKELKENGHLYNICNSVTYNDDGTLTYVMFTGEC